MTTPTPIQGNPSMIRPADKRTVEDRSPQDTVDPRNVRRRLNEFDIGEIFSSVEATLGKTRDEVVEAAPDTFKETVKKGFSGIIQSRSHGLYSYLSKQFYKLYTL